MKKNLYIIILIAFIFAKGNSQTWALQSSGTTQNLNSVFATNSATAYLVGNNGIGRKTTTSGTTWSTMNIGVTDSQYSIRFINATTGFISGSFQEILKTTNSGTSWADIGGGITKLNDGFFTSANSGWVAGDVEVGYGFLYNPFTFNLIQIPAIANKALRGIYFADSNTGWTVGNSGVIIKTTNSGSAWSAQTSGTTEQLNKVAFINSSIGIIVGNNGTILKTTNGGTTWTRITTSVTHNLNAIYFGDAQKAWICGDAGSILYSDNQGETWTTEMSNTTEKLNAIHGIGTSDIWTCGNTGTVIHRSNTLAVAENQLKPVVTVWPNPNSGKFTVEIKKTINGIIEIFDIAGKKLFQSEIKSSQHEINHNLSKGTYFYKIIDNDDMVSNGKLLIQ